MKKLLLLIGFISFTMNAQVPNYVPTNGLVGYWPFSGNANDISGNTNNGTVNGATLTTDRFGNANSAYNFNGTSNSIVLKPGTNIQGNNTRTISFWVNITNATQNTNTIYKGGNNGAGNDFSIWYNVNGNNTYQIQVRRFQDDVVTDAIPQTLNQWNNISVVYDGTNNSNLKIYINGQIYTGRAFTPAGVTFNTTSTTPQFGDLIDQLGVHKYLKGNIDDIAIWNRALTQQEITSLYNGIPYYSDTCNAVSGSLTQGLVAYYPFCGNANDDSGKGNNGTVNGATLTTDRFGNTNSAYNFNGTSNFISFPQKFNFHNAGDASISIWIKSNSISNTTQQATFLKSRLSSADNNRFNFFLNPISGNLLKLNLDYRESNFNIHILNINNIQINTWQNIIYTRNGNTYNLYINGTFINSSVDNLPNLPTEIGWVVGNDPSSNADYSGLIDDIGMWNRALTTNEITQLYNQNQCFTNTTVTETLVINVGQLSYTNPVAYANNITIYPNPASTQVNIAFNTISDLNGGSIKIINSLGQQVATTPIKTTGTTTTMTLSTWGGSGLYFVQIVNPQGQIVDIKKILLQ